MRGAIKSEESSFRKSGGAITEVQRMFAEWIVTDFVTVVCLLKITRDGANLPVSF